MSETADARYAAPHPDHIMTTDILNLSYNELEQFLVDQGEKKFRAAQVWQWLWKKGAREFSDMTNLSKPLRAMLANKADIVWPRVVDTLVAGDGTVKFLLELADRERVETVLIPEKGHFTQCLSTQVGCAMGCLFCSTGAMGFTRNMSMAEILGQILVARSYLNKRALDKPLRNLVFMGMGEPLLNLDELMRSLRALHTPGGLDFSSRRITVSSVGLARGLPELGESGLASLAISLHAPTQELRERIMPKAARLPLDELLALLDAYPLKPRQRVTYEYILMAGVNDSPEHAAQLARLLGQRKAKVNLIRYNASTDNVLPISYDAPSMDRVLAFEQVLWNKHITATLRRGKGADIAAACGQLKAARE